MTKTVVARTNVEVTAIGVPLEILGKQHLAAKVHVEQRHAKGREITDALSSLEIPGGIVSHESREYDADDKLLSTSKLELVEYHIPPAPEESHTLLNPFRMRQTAGVRFVRARQDCSPGWHYAAARRSYRQSVRCSR
jgi:hypothetical protein